jgi:hypothetical protein
MLECTVQYFLSSVGSHFSKSYEAWNFECQNRVPCPTADKTDSFTHAEWTESSLFLCLWRLSERHNLLECLEMSAIDRGLMSAIDRGSRASPSCYLWTRASINRNIIWNMARVLWLWLVTATTSNIWPWKNKIVRSPWSAETAFSCMSWKRIRLQ